MSANSTCPEPALEILGLSAVSEYVLLALICYSLFLLLSTGARLLGLINWLFFLISERVQS